MLRTRTQLRCVDQTRTSVMTWNQSVVFLSKVDDLLHFTGGKQN